MSALCVSPAEPPGGSPFVLRGAVRAAGPVPPVPAPHAPAAGGAG